MIRMSGAPGSSRTTQKIFMKSKQMESVSRVQTVTLRSQSYAQQVAPGDGYAAPELARLGIKQAGESK